VVTSTSAPFVAGEYHADSAAISLDFSAADLRGARAAYDALSPVEAESAEQFVARICSYDAAQTVHSTVSLNVLAPFLTYEHEAEHHRIVATTPFGLLVWRIFQALRVNLEFLLHAESRPVFHDFEGSTRPAVDTVERWLNEGKGDPPTYADQVSFECHVLRTYLGTLLDGRGMTRAAFASLANLAEKILASRSGVEAHRRIVIGSQSEGLLPLVPDGVPTALEIMEASAVLNEEALLVSKRVAPDLLEAWQSASLHGLYATAHEYFRRRFGFVRFGKLAADLSFCGPIDICSTQSDALPIDLLHPSLLLDRIARHAEGRALPMAMLRKEYAPIPFDDELFGGGIAAGLRAVAHAELWNDNFISPRRDSSEAPRPLDSPIDMVEVAINHAQRLQAGFKDAIGSRLQGFGRHSNMLVQETPYAPRLIAFRDMLAFPRIAETRKDESGEAKELREQLEVQHLLREYASSCAVRKVVLNVPPPQFLLRDATSYSESDFRGFVAAAYRSHFM